MNFRSIARLRKMARPGIVLQCASTLHHLRRLKRNEWKPPEELRRIQLARLRRLVAYAGAHVPYYRARFAEAGLGLDDLESLDDIRRLPVTTKSDLQENPTAFLSEKIGAARLTSTLTSGSTGTPLRVLRDRTSIAVSTALKAYGFLACGVKLSDTFVTLANSADSPWPNHSVVAPTSDIGPVVETLKRLRPDVLYSYPIYLACLAECDVTGIAPRLVFSQGMTLTPHHRDIVRSALGAEVFDTYGSVEFSRLAFECRRHSGLHTITDWAVVEFLADGEPVAPGEPGEIVVSGLYNYAQPLIRYNLGDIGVPSDATCACGRRWPLIESIEGRAIDRLCLPSGKSVSANVIFRSIHEEVERHLFCLGWTFGSPIAWSPGGPERFKW